MEVKHATDYIETIIKRLDPATEVNFFYEDLLYHLTIVFRNQTFSISFGSAEMSDLNNSIREDSVSSDRRIGQENNIKFKIYILLGRAGVLPEFKISEELLEEKRDWLKGELLHTGFEHKLSATFSEGLKRLSLFIKEISVKYKRNLPGFVEDKERMDDLIEYYSKEKIFDGGRLSVETLGYLKAAAVCEIINKEREKEGIKMQDVLISIDQEIYDIVSELRKAPFFQIEMPRCIYAYAQETKKESEKDKLAYFNDKMNLLNNWVPFAVNKKVFIAHRFQETELVSEVKVELKKINFEFREGKVKDCGFITDDILNKIKECSFFLALITPLKEFKDGKFSTSSWILMEIGVAIALGRKTLVLADDRVEQEEYAKKLQAETQYEIFDKTDFKKKIAIIIDRIKNEWEKQES